MKELAVLAVSVFVLAGPFLPAGAAAAEGPIILWPEGAPGARGDAETDKPKLHLYPAAAETNTSTAVVVCPGGGYGGLAMTYEGHQVAAWLNARGVSAGVLEYRTKPYAHPAPLADVQRALRYLRAHSAELSLSPERIGVLGFSAGGHLAASAGTLFDAGDREASDPVERVSSRPDFMILAYPVITMTLPFTHRGSRRNLLGEDPGADLVRELSLETRVRASSPPAFLFHTGEDSAVPVENSLLFYRALRQSGVPAEMHLYREGWHGVGLDRHTTTAAWPQDLHNWMHHLGLLHHPEDPLPRWVWTSTPAARQQDAYFRKTFTAGADLREAFLVATADDEIVVWVNGKYRASGGSWKSPLRVELEGTLLPGTNVVAVRARNGRDEVAGLIGRIVLRSGDGTETILPTDRSWSVSGRGPEGWNEATFDAERARFQPATEIAALGDEPWTDVTEDRLAAAEVPPPPQATPGSDIKLAPGFRVELLYSVPKPMHGSWVSLAVDPEGRLLAGDQYGALYRFTPPAIGGRLEPAAIEKVQLDIGGAHGLHYAFDSLYVMRNERPGPAGLYRIRDTDGDDLFDDVKLLRAIPGSGEHGVHSIVSGPDGKSLYVCAGNHTDLPDMEASAVPRVWQEDLLLPRMWDANGHARGRLAPGGWIARTDPEGKTWELVTIGYRNEFDLAFSPEGDLFTYDADMEWDVGTPWYRPTRINHAASGADFGWRSGTGKWPSYYPDSLGSVVDIGPGCPTGMVFGTGARFPEKYQRALFICDWSYGKMYAVHLEPDGSTWRGTPEQFMAASPLPLTDVLIHPQDGALYVAIGGRRAQSGLYRVTHSERPEAVALAPRSTPEMELRRSLERFHTHPDKSAVDAAWQHLAHADRGIRYAARVAIEHRPVAEWQERALGEERPRAAIEALIALARHGDAALGPRVLAALERLAWDPADETESLALLRAYQLAFVRLGRPEPESARRLAVRLGDLYPAATADLNRELSRVLVYLEADGVVEKTLKLLEEAPTQEEQIHYALVLRAAERGWNLEQRSRYFAWFQNAAGFRGGASFAGFLQNIKAEALRSVSAADKEKLASVLEEKPAGEALAILPQAKGPGRDWTLEELLPLMANGLKGRDFDNGRKMFAAASCFACHRFNGNGGAMAPDLTGVGGRFNARDLIESIVEPSKTISDQYEATVFELKDDLPVTGRIVNMAGDHYFVSTNMLDPGHHVTVERDRIHRMRPSKTSMMPAGLLQRLNEDEVLDLLAFLLSRGDPADRMFAD